MGLARPARWLALGLAGAGIFALVALLASRLDLGLAWGAMDLVPLLAVLAAWTAVPVAFVAGRRSRADEAKLSSDLDAVSRRLLRLEADVGGAPVLVSPISPIEEIVEDIGSLSRVVKDLAETAAGHERAIAALGHSGTAGQAESRAWEAPDVIIPPPPPPVIPSFFPVREPAPDRLEAPPAPPPPRPSHAGILEALDAGRLDLHVQPIVSLPQRQTRVYESFALLTSAEGDAFVPAEFLPALERLQKLPRLDQLVVTRAFDAARRARSGRRRVPVSCHLSGASLSDPVLVERLERMMEDGAGDARLVIEVTQQAWLAADPRVMRRLLGAGLSFALDQIEQFDLDPDMLVPAGIRYVKIPARTIMAAQDKPTSGRNVAASPELLAGSGVEIVASLVEDDSIVPELIDLRIPLAQGFAFALPSPVASVFGTDDGDAEAPGSAWSPAAGTETPEPSEPARPENRSFREFLRRAG